jgi:Protein of unknown function (DUF3800)
MAKDYVIYCDESIARGVHFSNFYGGALITSDDIDFVRQTIAVAKAGLNLHGEVKWQKITEAYKEKYISLMDVFFVLIAAGKVKVRIMFTQNMYEARDLTPLHHENDFFLLYYQFLKHAFGFLHHPPASTPTRLRLLLDQLPDTKEKADRFRGYLCGLSSNPAFRAAKLTIEHTDISDVSSHDHNILQCLDVVLGSMQFRLNDKRKEIPPGKKRRGKRTRAKEDVYKHINERIRLIYPRFNIGISTGTAKLADRWHHPYRHWKFVPSEYEVVGGSKKKK